MRIGLIDADLMWRPRANGRRYGHQKADIFPNLALMKLSAYHKQKADPVYKSLQRWVNNRAIFHTVDTFEKYDKIKAKE